MFAISRMQLGFLIAALAMALFIQYRAHAEPFPEAKTIGQDVASFQELSDRFTALAKKKGGTHAFAVLKIAPLPPGTDLHLLGHAVGDILYTQQGVDGVKECTQDFRNACSHSIVIGALNEYGAGESTIEKIRAACTLAPGGSGAYTMCFHGLGHGVFAYFGYDIPKTVAFCQRLGTPEYGEQEFTQCVGGMTMELMGGGGHDRDLWVRANERYFDPRDPLAPCDRTLIPQVAKTFCYMYLTPHLFSAAGADLASPEPATFPRAFSFCSAIADAQQRGACYGSFGKEFVPLAAARDIRSIDAMSDDQYKEAIGWCMLAPNDEARAACIGQALASVFWGGENDPSASFRFCALVEKGPIHAACYQELSRNIASYISGDTRASLCEKLPTEYAQSCQSASYAPAERP